MRSFIYTITATLVLVAFTFANQNNVNTQLITDNFVKGLNHDNNGVVESTIRVVILMKIKYPDVDYDKVADELEELIMEGATRNIRVKALIANDYLNNFDQYSWLKNINYEEGSKVFDAYLDSISLNRIANTD